MKSHNLEKKSSKRRRGFGKDYAVSDADTRAVSKMFGRKGAK